MSDEREKLFFHIEWRKERRIHESSGGQPEGRKNRFFANSIVSRKKNAFQRLYHLIGDDSLGLRPLRKARLQFFTLFRHNFITPQKYTKDTTRLLGVIELEMHPHAVK